MSFPVSRKHTAQKPGSLARRAASFLLAFSVKNFVRLEADDLGLGEVFVEIAPVFGTKSPDQ